MHSFASILEDRLSSSYGSIENTLPCVHIFISSSAWIPAARPYITNSSPHPCLDLAKLYTTLHRGWARGAHLETPRHLSTPLCVYANLSFCPDILFHDQRNPCTLRIILQVYNLHSSASSADIAGIFQSNLQKIKRGICLCLLIIRHPSYCPRLSADRRHFSRHNTNSRKWRGHYLQFV